MDMKKTLWLFGLIVPMVLSADNFFYESDSRSPPSRDIYDSRSPPSEIQRNDQDYIRDDEEVADRRNLYEYNLYDRMQNENQQNYYYYQQGRRSDNNNQSGNSNRSYYFKPSRDD